MTQEYHREPPVYPEASSVMEETRAIRTLRASNFSCSKVTRRIFSPEEASFGRHGVFNPSCAWDGEKALVIARAEHSEATWSGRFITEKATPCLSEMRIENGEPVFSYRHKPIKTGMPSPVRSEDWRLFTYKGETWTNFTTYFFLNDGWPQKDVKARTCLGKLDGDRIRFINEMSIPECTDEEKNWVFFEHEGKLKFIYSIEPWRIFTCDDNGEIQGEFKHDLSIKREVPKFLANSTNPVLVNTQTHGECYMLLYHYFIDPLANAGGTRNRIYYQFILFFDKNTLMPLSHTYRPVLMGGLNTQGRHDNVLYASGAFQCGEDICVLSGEGDYYSRYDLLDLNKIETKNLTVL